MRMFKSLKSRFRRRKGADKDYHDRPMGRRPLSSRFRLRKKQRADTDYHEQPLGRRSAAKIFGDILLFPIRVLFLPFKALGLFHEPSVKPDEYDKNVSFTKRLKRFGKSVVLFPVKLLQAPVKFFKLLKAAGGRELLFILPALVVIGFFAFVFVQVFARGDLIDYRYQRGAIDAFDNKDYELAKTYFQRILTDKKLTAAEKYQWAMILAATDEPRRAEAVIEEIAPDDAIGYGPAHTLMAVSYVRQLGETKDPSILRKLRWHLENSKEDSPQIQQIWASYYMAVEQPEDAISAMNKAATSNPGYYAALATIYKQQGRETESQNALKEGAKVFRRLLDKDKLNNEVRIALASTLAKLEDYDEAEKVLLQGVRIQRDAQILRAAADFYVLRHDLAREEGADSDVQMQYLVRAINYDPNYHVVYNRMLAVFMDANQSPESAANIKKEFLDIVTSDNPTALAHFALSNILWQEGDHEKAEFHLEQAYTLNKNIVIVLNNLAYMIADGEDPDLERALELSEAAVSQVPDNAQFRDTLGIIYMKMGRHKDAVSEFQRALPGEADKKAVHAKLAICYDALGMDELAKIHLQKSQPENKK